MIGHEVCYVKSTLAIRWLHSLERGVPLSNGGELHPWKDASYRRERSELSATMCSIVLLVESENCGFGRSLASVEIVHIKDR